MQLNPIHDYCILSQSHYQFNRYFSNEVKTLSHRCRERFVKSVLYDVGLYSKNLFLLKVIVVTLIFYFINNLSMVCELLNSLYLSLFIFLSTLVELINVTCAGQFLCVKSMKRGVNLTPWATTTLCTLDTGSTLIKRTEPYLSRLTIYPIYPTLIIVLRILVLYYTSNNHIDWTTYLSLPVCNEIILQIIKLVSNVYL